MEISATHGGTPPGKSPSASARRRGLTATLTQFATGWRTGCSSGAWRQGIASRSCRATRTRSPPCASRWPGSAACSCRSTSCSTRKRSPTSCAAPAPARSRSATSSRHRQPRLRARHARDPDASAIAVRRPARGDESAPDVAVASDSLAQIVYERHRIAAKGRHAYARRRPVAVPELHRRRRNGRIDVILHALPMYHCAQLDVFLGPAVYRRDQRHRVRARAG